MILPDTNFSACILDEVAGHVPASEQKEPRLYVLTVNYNSEALLKRLVESLQAVSFVKKLVVVNHSPGDQLEGLYAGFPIQVIHQLNRGYGAGLNRALQEVSDPDGLILLCNLDVVVLNHEAIQDIWRYMNDHPSVELVVPALVDAQLRPIFSCRKFYSLVSLLLVSNPWLRKLMPKVCGDHYCVPTRAQTPREVDWGSGAAIFMRGSGKNGRPLFDERFFLYFEDVDLCARMWQAGRSVVYFPGLVLQHLEQRLSHENARYFLVHLASLLKFILKYKGLPNRATLQDNWNGLNGRRSLHG